MRLMELFAIPRVCLAVAIEIHYVNEVTGCRGECEAFPRDKY